MCLFFCSFLQVFLNCWNISILACTFEGFPAMVCVFVMPLRCKIPYTGRVFQIDRCFQRQTETVSPYRKDYLRCISNGFIQREGSPLVCYASSIENENEIQIKILDSYFDKLREDCDDRTARLDDEDVPQSRRGLNSLEDYLERLNQDKLSSQQKSFITSEPERADDRSMKRKEVQHNPRMNPRAPQQFDEPSNLYLISIIASVNIAVFLFEIASPVKSSSLDLFTLPLLYGAKVNDLILVGEWWRLITPMFLHSGILHMGLGCWALATFGTRVCKGYGPFTFLLIYFLGGISGNLTSFLHTPYPTVGGTGPTFSMIGAWLIYQMQNKDLLSKDVSEAMFQRAIIITTLTFILSNYGPIDDWTHLGAAVTGIIYGYFTCPTLQMDDASATSSSGPEEGISLVSKPADPCKSLLVFAFVILVFGCLIFFIEPPIGTLVTEDGFS